MKHVYANLLGKWENLNDDPNSLIFESSPNIYVADEIFTMFNYDFINIYYKGITYKIHPTFIQVVTG